MTTYIRHTPLSPDRTDTKGPHDHTKYDATIRELLDSRETAESMSNLDPFLKAFYEVLVNYSRNRIPSHLLTE